MSHVRIALWEWRFCAEIAAQTDLPFNRQALALAAARIPPLPDVSGSWHPELRRSIMMALLATADYLERSQGVSRDEAHSVLMAALRATGQSPITRWILMDILRSKRHVLHKLRIAGQAAPRAPLTFEEVFWNAGRSDLAAVLRSFVLTLAAEPRCPCAA